LIRATLKCQIMTKTPLRYVCRCHVDAVYKIYVSDYSKPELEATLTASMMLLSNLLQKLNTVSDDSLCGLRGAVSLALYLASSCDQTKPAAYSLEETMLFTLNLVSSWVAEQFQAPFQIETQHETTYKTEEMKVSSRVVHCVNMNTSPTFSTPYTYSFVLLT